MWVAERRDVFHFELELRENVSYVAGVTAHVGVTFLFKQFV